MEISNKAFGLFCIAVVGVTVYVRAQSVQSTAQAPKAVEAPQVVAEAPKKHRPIPNSAMPPDPFATTDADQPAADDLPVTVDTLPATPPATAPAQTSAPAATDTPPADTGDEEDLTYQDDIGPMADAAPTNNSLQITDRDLLRIMMNSMPEEQRDSFRMMWFTMSPDDRQDFLDQLRDSQQGG